MSLDWPRKRLHGRIRCFSFMIAIKSTKVAFKEYLILWDRCLVSRYLKFSSLVIQISRANLPYVEGEGHAKININRGILRFHVDHVRGGGLLMEYVQLTLLSRTWALYQATKRLFLQLF